MALSVTWRALGDLQGVLRPSGPPVYCPVCGIDLKTNEAAIVVGLLRPGTHDYMEVRCDCGHRSSVSLGESRA